MYRLDQAVDQFSGAPMTAPQIDVKSKAPSALLTPEALRFLTELEVRFGARRRQLLSARHQAPFDFLTSTQSVRESAWSVAPVPDALLDRRVEITGPAEPKMI